VWNLSKRSKEHSAAVADWDVVHRGGTMTVESSWYRRAKTGAYQFRNSAGIAAEFPPGAIYFIRPSLAHPEPAGPDPAGAGK
jgi:hypothetical protein